MTAHVLRGAGLSGRLKTEIGRASALLVDRGGRPPRLATLLIGDDPSSRAYRLSIERTMLNVGIAHVAIDLVTETTADAVAHVLADLSLDPEVTGVLVLMPLPERIHPRVIYDVLSPFKDVDGITPTNAGRLHMGLPSLRPSTPQGGIELLDHYGIEIEGRRAVVIGRSNVVGRPLGSLLLQRHATVTLCHRQTVDLGSISRTADILAIAAGHAGLIRGDMVKPGATVLDFGVNVVDGKVVGDADFGSVADVAGAITPVPGGTGPVTALVLARNTVAAGLAALGGTLDHADFLRRAAFDRM